MPFYVLSPVEFQPKAEPIIKNIHAQAGGGSADH